MKSKFVRKILRFPASKRTIRRRRTSEMIHMWQPGFTWPRVSTQLQHRVPPFPQLTNSRLQTAAVGLPAPYEPHGNREHRRTLCCLECCQSDDPQVCSEKGAIEPKTTIQNINDRPVFRSYLTGCIAALSYDARAWKLKIENCSIEPNTTIQNINDRPVLRSYLTGCIAALSYDARA